MYLNLKMESISERIAAVMKELGFNKNSFSKAIGMGNNVTIGRIINERRDPSYEVLQKIIQTFGHVINARWLLTGEGQMKAENPANVVHDPEERYSIDQREQVGTILTNLEFLSDSMKTELKKLKDIVQ